jgi:putative endonuclease
VGVTSSLAGRAWEHRNKTYPDSFSARYNCVMLVYYRHFDDITEAIAEEKRIKAGSRKHKEALIDALNPEWKDLHDLIEY